MYKQILVPIDGSETAQRGLGEAIELAKLAGASLRVVHMIDGLSHALLTRDGVEQAAMRHAEMKASGHALLERAVQQARQAGVSQVDSVLDEDARGRVAEMVNDQAKQWGADLIVLGTHGRRGLGRLLLGSDAEAVVRSAHVPILLVRGTDS